MKTMQGRFGGNDQRGFNMAWDLVDRDGDLSRKFPSLQKQKTSRSLPVGLRGDHHDTGGGRAAQHIL